MQNAYARMILGHQVKNMWLRTVLLKELHLDRGESGVEEEAVANWSKRNFM